MYLSVIVPAYNEDGILSKNIKKFIDYLSQRDYDYEIIIVNDGSIDNTEDVARQLMSEIKNLRLISNKINRGKGAAVREGILTARGKYRLFIDADNAVSMDHIEKFWPYIKKNDDIVIGSIEVMGSVKKEEYVGFSKIYRNALGKLSKYLIRILAIWEIHDTQRGFKLFRAKAAEEIFSRQTIMRWGFDIEILLIAKCLGCKIKELPVKWENPPGKPTFISYLNTLKELVQIKWNLIKGKYKKEKTKQETAPNT